MNKSRVIAVVVIATAVASAMTVRVLTSGTQVRGLEDDVSRSGFGLRWVGTSIEVQELGATLSGAVWSIPTSMTEPGDFAPVAFGESVAFCGTDNSGSTPTGVALVTGLDNGNLTLLGSEYTAPASCFAGIAYSPASSSLYLLETSTPKIMRASYVPGSPTPTSWVTVAGSADLAGIADIANYAIDLEAGNANPDLDQIVLYPYSTRDDQSVQPFAAQYVFTRPGGVPTVAVLHSDTRAFHSTAMLVERLEVGATTIDVTGPVGETVSIVQADNSNLVLGSTVIDSQGDGQVVVPAIPLAGVFAAFAAGAEHPSPPFLAPLLSIGFSEDLPNGSRLGNFSKVFGMHLYVGNSDFSVYLPLEHDIPAQVQEATYDALLIIGTPDQLVPLPGNQFFLNGIATVPCTACISDSPNDPGVVTASVPISPAPGLAGAQLCFQFLTVISLEPLDFRLSEVCCAVMQPERFVPPYYPPAESAESSSGGRRWPRSMTVSAGSTNSSSGNDSVAIVNWLRHSGADMDPRVLRKFMLGLSDRR